MSVTTYPGTDLPMSRECLLELRILGTLCSRLRKAGWTPKAIDTGDDDVNNGWVTVSTAKQVKDEFFSVGQATVRFTNGTATHGVFLVGGNGVDLLSDWSYSEPDTDGFNAAMEAIGDYIEETYDR